MAWNDDKVKELEGKLDALEKLRPKIDELRECCFKASSTAEEGQEVITPGMLYRLKWIDRILDEFVDMRINLGVAINSLSTSPDASHEESLMKIDIKYDALIEVLSADSTSAFITSFQKNLEAAKARARNLSMKMRHSFHLISII